MIIYDTICGMTSKKTHAHKHYISVGVLPPLITVQAFSTCFPLRLWTDVFHTRSLQYVNCLSFLHSAEIPLESHAIQGQVSLKGRQCDVIFLYSGWSHSNLQVKSPAPEQLRPLAVQSHTGVSSGRRDVSEGGRGSVPFPRPTEQLTKLIMHVWNLKEKFKSDTQPGG